MLSIGIRLSIEDFALAFKRYKIFFPQEFLQFIYNYFLFLRDSGYTHQFAYLFHLLQAFTTVCGVCRSVYN